MRRAIILPSIALFFSLFLLVSLSQYASAGKAGVGVLNVPPEYRSTRVVYSDGMVKIYLTVSDYNSWRDIYKVDLYLESGRSVVAHFRFKQYNNTNSYNEIDQFKEVKGNGYLFVDLCKTYHSSSRDTVDDRCLLNVIFAFSPVPCNKLSVHTYDRSNLSAKVLIDYTIGESARSDKVIMPFWSDKPVEVSPDLVNIIALSSSSTVTVIMMFRRRWFNEK